MGGWDPRWSARPRVDARDALVGAAGALTGVVLTTLLVLALPVLFPAGPGEDVNLVGGWAFAIGPCLAAAGTGCVAAWGRPDGRLRHGLASVLVTLGLLALVWATAVAVLSQRADPGARFLQEFLESLLAWVFWSPLLVAAGLLGVAVASLSWRHR
jgi:hypothetical protein